MNERLKKDDELSSRELDYLISKVFGGMTISAAAIRVRLRLKLKWKVVRTCFGPMISVYNKGMRNDFAMTCLKEKDNFSDVIWTDESQVQL